MNIAVIGGGGREHALIKKLKESPDCGKIYALPGNGGIAADAECVAIKATEVDEAANWCAQNNIDYVVVAPDDPLALGLVDMLAERGIPAFGPGKAAAQIEASKAFAKNLMRKYGIPTAGYGVYDNIDAARGALDAQTIWPVVLKADGLALGKGVSICQNRAEAEAALCAMMEDKVFGGAGSRVVIEEYLTGPEVSVLAFCDGETVVPMVSSMDHKRAFDGDEGPNTGGMGTVAPNPYYSSETAARCMEEIFLPTMRAMKAEGAPFKGCLYFGLMLTPQGPKVIEYNCRFGDPETQVVLPLMESDLLCVMQACTNGTLAAQQVRFRPGAAACVVMASGGYPAAYKTGLPITGLQKAAKLPGVTVYHAGTKLEDGELLTAGGRVLGVTAVAASLPEALAGAYRGAEEICFEGAHYRKDIGAVKVGWE